MRSTYIVHIKIVRIKMCVDISNIVENHPNNEIDIHFQIHFYFFFIIFKSLAWKLQTVGMRGVCLTACVYTMYQK